MKQRRVIRRCSLDVNELVDVMPVKVGKPELDDVLVDRSLRGLTPHWEREAELIVEGLKRFSLKYWDPTRQMLNAH
jgi:hypothetical protein